MTKSAKTTALVVLTYVLFGLINLLQGGSFVVPVVYVDLFVFVLTSVVFLQEIKSMRLPQWIFFAYASLSFLAHPFIWEICFNQETFFSVIDHVAFDIMRAVKWLLLATSFLLIGYDKSKNVLKIEWLLMTLLALVPLFFSKSWYSCMLFVIAGWWAYYAIARRKEVEIFHYHVLIGMGVMYFVNLFFPIN